jgi:hypothetical protein
MSIFFDKLRIASYLTRTLDTGYCNENNVGVIAYSLARESVGWQEPEF